MSASPKPVAVEFMQRTRRIAVRFRAEYYGRRLRGSGTVQNISLTGALLEEATPTLLAGADILLRFAFFGDSLPVELPARVVRETPRGFAVRFLSLDRRLRQILSFAISKAALAEQAPLEDSPLLQTLRDRRP